MTNKESYLQNSDGRPTRDAAIRLTMMPRDTNACGTVFGGVILSYIDVAGTVEAARKTGHDRFVTCAMHEVRFHEPVYTGDLVSFYAETIRIGKTSITTRITVEAERFGSCGQLVRVTEAEVIYVAINQNREKLIIGDIAKGASR
jgi:acyl-CoA thioesterase YciA